MNKLKPHFQFNQQERSGIFFLLLLIIIFQVGYYFLSLNGSQRKQTNFILDKEEQAKIDRLKSEKIKKDTLFLFPFNPNFINEAKGYNLGMSLAEIDRLHQFRETNSYVNSKEEFQKVTLVSDSLLQQIAPYFKFPDWVHSAASRDKVAASNPTLLKEKKKTPVQKQDLNTATLEDLKQIRGIGTKLSERIIKFRNRLGGFLLDEQLQDVYGLEPEVTKKVLEKFTVVTRPAVEKINLNTCSPEELSKIVYLNYSLSERIIGYRNAQNGIKSLEELKKIEGFPAEKIDRISLYLSL